MDTIISNRWSELDSAADRVSFRLEHDEGSAGGGHTIFGQSVNAS